MNSIHLLMLEQLRHRRERLRLSLDRFEHSRKQFAELLNALRQRHNPPRGDAPRRSTKAEAPPYR